MIPFASQRGLGQDLATHLLNEHDNEKMEVADIRGAIARDLHGAFAEWEAQAHALTRCQNYLYSLSINPDPKQEALTREEYLDYIARAEDKLGLAGQPRAIVFHSKHGREHCHVVWSRVDADNERAVQLAFDREKLMMVTREFARDHGLSLPDGYHKNPKDRQGDQLSLYEMHQQRITGISKDEHQEAVTDAWRSSDNPKAFTQALAEKGYLLATGKRPYVLVDYYGHTHSLPKLIADKSVQTKDVRAFLEKDCPPESLPDADQAKELIAKHRAAIETHSKAEVYNEELAELRRQQEERRSQVQEKQSSLRKDQHTARQQLAGRHKAERDALRKAHLAEKEVINEKRAKNRPGKFQKIFGRVTGYAATKKALQKYQDQRRTKRHLKDKQRLKEQQADQRLELARRQEMQSLDMARKLRALSQLEKREFRSFEEAMKKETRITERGSRNQMPSLAVSKESIDSEKGRDGPKIRRSSHSRKRDQNNDRGR